MEAAIDSPTANDQELHCLLKTIRRAKNPIAVNHAYAQIIDKWGKTMEANLRRKNFRLDPDECSSAVHECLIRAVREFDSERGDFCGFWWTITHRELANRYKHDTREKRNGNRTAISIDTFYADDLTLATFIADHHDHVDEIARHEEAKLFWDRLNRKLSRQERQVIDGLYKRGETYQEVADRLGIDRKFVDNARSRVIQKGELLARYDHSVPSRKDADPLPEEIVCALTPTQPHQGPLEYLKTVRFGAHDWMKLDLKLSRVEKEICNLRYGADEEIHVIAETTGRPPKWVERIIRKINATAESI